MSRYDNLDNDIIDVGRPFTEPPLTDFDRGMFFTSLRKLAAPGLPAPDQDLAEHEQKMVSGDEASPADAEQMYQQGVPDTAGHLEGEFAVPLEQAVLTMAQLVSHELKLQLAYIFYAEMLRGLNRDLAETFEELAEAEIKDAKYLLRRISVLSPGGVPIPVPPSPAPLTDQQQILQQMITGEQQAIVLLKALRAQMGENPMKFTVEEMLSEEQGHLDRLWQYMPAEIPEKQAASAGQKIAMATKLAKGKGKVTDSPELQAATGALIGNVLMGSGAGTLGGAIGGRRGNPDRPWSGAVAGGGGASVGHAAGSLLRHVNPVLGRVGEALGSAMGAALGVHALRKAVSALNREKKSSVGALPIAVPAPGAEPVEHYLLREQQLQLQQAQAETQDMGIRLQQMQAVSEQHQQAADQANMAAQQAAMQAEQASQQAAISQQQAVSSSEAATAAQEQAAQQAEAKMRLSMRIQQIRQQLADLASQDPVAEEGLNMGGQAGPGGPMTPMQQQEQQAAEQQAQQMAAEQEQAAASGGSRAKKEVQQAQKAQQNAQVQQQQAQLAGAGV